MDQMIKQIVMLAIGLLGMILAAFPLIMLANIFGTFGHLVKGVAAGLFSIGELFLALAQPFIDFCEMTIAEWDDSEGGGA